MRNLVPGSPSLKEVTIQYGYGIQVLKFDRHPSLAELNVCHCIDLEKVDLATSDIKMLAIEIHYPLSKIICPNVVTLERYGDIDEVNLDCGSRLNDVTLFLDGLHLEHGEFKTLVEKLGNNANVTLGNWTMLVFSMWDLQMEVMWEILDQPWPSFSWKSVTMTLNLAKWHLPGICYLLWTCKCLETLTIYIYPSNAEDALGNIFSKRNFDGRTYWCSIGDDPFHCLSCHLKNVMLYACVTELDVIELIEFLLGKALVLEKMEISTERNFGQTGNEFLPSADNIGPQKDSTPDTLLNFSKEVFSLPRISPRAVVHMAVC